MPTDVLVVASGRRIQTITAGDRYSTRPREYHNVLGVHGLTASVTEKRQVVPMVRARKLLPADEVPRAGLRPNAVDERARWELVEQALIEAERLGTLDVLVHAIAEAVGSSRDSPDSRLGPSGP